MSGNPNKNKKSFFSAMKNLLGGQNSPVPQQREQEERNGSTHDQINTLVTYFMEKMQEVGSPGLAEPRDNPNGCDFRSYGKDGDYSELPWDPKGVWLMPNGLTYACIYPDGRWTYIAPIFNNRTNEVEYYWRISSTEDSDEPSPGFPYEPYEATHEIAYSLVRNLVVEQLTKHNPSALTELPFA